jgi:hypothetical protein
MAHPVLATFAVCTESTLVKGAISHSHSGEYENNFLLRSIVM